MAARGLFRLRVLRLAVVLQPLRPGDPRLELRQTLRHQLGPTPRSDARLRFRRQD